MSKYIDPSCGVPIFMMDNSNVARRCGRLNGFITASFFTILIIIGTIIVTIRTNKKRTDQYGNTLAIDKDKKFVWWPILSGCIWIIFVWLFFPLLTGFVYKTQYGWKEVEKRMMKKRGLSDKEIYQQQQGLYEKRLESRARIQAAQIQADAFRRK